MVNKWEEGQIYVWVGKPEITFPIYLHDNIDVKKYITLQSETFFTMLEKPRSTKNGNLAKILTKDGEVFWVRLEREEWTPLSKNWLRKKNNETKK